MKNSLLKILEIDSKSFRLKPSRKLSVFMICLFIATFFWLLNQLTKTYRISVYVPLKYVNLPNDRVITNYLPGKLQFQIEGDGFSLLSVNEESEFDSVDIDIRTLRVNTYGKKYRAVMSTQQIHDKVADQLGSKIVVQQVSQDTLSFLFEDKLIKELPVVFNAEFNTAKQYLLKGKVEYSPKQVEVIGPFSIVDQLNEISTKTVVYNDLEESVEGKVELLKPNSYVQFNYSEIEYRAEVEDFTEKEIDLPIEIANIPDSLALTLYPSKVKVKYRVGLSMFDKVGQHNLKAFVDYQEIAKDHPSKVKVLLDPGKNSIELVSLMPERVEYIIRK